MSALICNTGYRRDRHTSCGACPSFSSSCTSFGLLPGTITAVTCKTGFYLSAALLCDSCATGANLKAGDGLATIIN
jgi:hypothetical protein